MTTTEINASWKLHRKCATDKLKPIQRGFTTLQICCASFKFLTRTQITIVFLTVRPQSETAKMNGFTVRDDGCIPVGFTSGTDDFYIRKFTSNGDFQCTEDVQVQLKPCHLALTRKNAYIVSSGEPPYNVRLIGPM